MIDRFTKERFEEVLPKSLWVGHGLVAGEYQYAIPVPGPQSLVQITIRSSVREDGLAATAGADSIRCWLTDKNGRPLANKTKAYVSRVPGWEERMLETLRELWRKGKRIQICCNSPMGELTVKGNGPNKGRKFRKCRECNKFEWVEG